MCPWIRKGSKVYKRENGKLVLVGKSKTVATAKRYAKALYAHSGDSARKKKRRRHKA